jgi:cytoskeletal protein RodZ
LDEIKSNTSDNSSKNNSSLKRIGNFIKEARVSRNKSIEELASDLKIGSHQLQAIEEGNEDHLPEKVFIKAMVRRISEKLKVDTDFIMSEFKTEREEVNIEEIVQEVSIKAKKNRNVKNNNSMEVIIFILISGILGLLASSLIFNIFSESFQNQLPKEELIIKN